MIKQLMKLESMEIVSKSRFSKQLGRVQTGETEKLESQLQNRPVQVASTAWQRVGGGYTSAGAPRVVESAACDNTPNQHASKHNASTGHPAITSFEQGENWFYDYRTGDSFAGPKLPDPHADAHALDQPVPGPAGRIPVEWQSLLHE